MAMMYVALLRGINVGGNRKVEMKRLKFCFESVGMSAVKTYINSGNVIFSTNEVPLSQLASHLERALEKEFGFNIPVVVRTFDQLQTIIHHLPTTWQNNDQTKCDVLFLWEEIDHPDILDRLGIKPDLEVVKYVAGAVLWYLPRQNVTRSALLKLVGTKLYSQMTVRNCNTVRKLYDLLKDVQD